MFLSREELQALTGYQLHAWQRKWLDKHGWKYEVAANGRPVVSSDYAKSKLSGPAPKKAWAPNLAAIK